MKIVKKYYIKYCFFNYFRNFIQQIYFYFIKIFINNLVINKAKLKNINIGIILFERSYKSY